VSFTKVRYAALTDVGVKRSHNQDACTAQPAADEAVYRQLGHVFVVADGMGGHAVGEKASAKAVRDIPLGYQKYARQEPPAAAIRRSFTEANADIYDIGQKNPEFKGLGTTATALFLRPDGAWVGHVGDSRAYRIRRGKVEQLTFDHSWVWEIARRQGVDPDELGDFKKNVIIRSLGPDAEVEVDVEGPHPVEPGDAFLLCSDGLSNQVPADEIGAAVSSMPADEAARFLVELANVRGGPDNITCLIVQVPHEDGSTAPAGTRPAAGGLRRLLAAVDKVVPWSYLALGLGSVTAGVSLWLRADLPGLAVALFLLAAGLIAAGVVGLLLHLRRTSAAGDPGHADDAPAELHVYKGYPFEVGSPLFARLADEEVAIRESLKAKDGAVDWAAYQALCDDAEAKLAKAELVPAYRVRCQAFQVLAVAFNKDRGKDEGFRPNYNDKPPH
jgi:protein phosphatase